MEKSDSPEQESIVAQLIEAVSNRSQNFLEIGNTTCQVCGCSFEPGDAVVAYVFRPVGESAFRVGNIICGNKTHAHPTDFTLGVRELLVEGRIQQSSEAESSPLVITDPEILAESKPSTKSAQKTFSDVNPLHEGTDPDAPPTMLLGESRRANQSAEPAHPGLGGER